VSQIGYGYGTVWRWEVDFDSWSECSSCSASGLRTSTVLNELTSQRRSATVFNVLAPIPWRWPLVCRPSSTHVHHHPPTPFPPSLHTTYVTLIDKESQTSEEPAYVVPWPGSSVILHCACAESAKSCVTTW